MSWRAAWKARHYRIIPIIESLGIDVDEALDRLEAIAKLPPMARPGHTNYEVLEEIRIAVVAEIEESSWTTGDLDDDRVRAASSGTDGSAAPARPDVDPDDCPCDGCGLRRLKYRREP